MALKYTAIMTCSNTAEATFMRAFFEENDVPARVSGGEGLGFTGRYRTMARGVEVLVRTDCLDRARTLLAEADSGAFAAGEDAEAAEAEEELLDYDPETYQPLRCPACASTAVHSRSAAPAPVKLASMLLLGLPLLFLPRARTCTRCGHEWQSTDEAPTHDGRVGRA